MPKDAPTPITPEGKRAAAKIRNLFAYIVAANIALVAVVVWQGYFGKKGNSSPEEVASVTDELMDRSIVAYNEGDTRAFSALFTTKEGFNPAARHEEYHREFGRVLTKKRLSTPETQHGEGVLVVHEVTSEKVPAARLITLFSREKPGVKLLEWRIERP